MEVESTYGSTYKYIRQARKLSQHNVTKESISRSSLSKFEHNKQTIYLDNFLSLLDELDLSVSEFMFINNNYQLEYGDQLKEEFYGNHFTGNTESYGELVQEIEKYLEHDYDWYLEMMKHYLNLIIDLDSDTTGEQLEKVRKLVEDIWNLINSRDEWFMNDIKLLNVIIYYLPNKLADNAIQKLLKRAQDYIEADQMHILLPSLQLNASLVYIKNGMYEKATQCAHEALESAQLNHRYDIYVAALVRKGTSLKDFGMIHNGLQIASDIRDHKLYEFLNIEVIKNIPMYFTKYPEDMEKMDWKSDEPEEQEYKFNGYYWFAI